MGRSFTPQYAVEFKTDNGRWTPQGWRGRATPARLRQFCLDYEASTQPGGVNAHLGATRILAARIVTNRGERILVTEYRNP